MKQEEWNEALNHLDADLVESFITQKDALDQSKKLRHIYFRVAAVAACLCLLIGTCFVIFLLGKNDPKPIPTPQSSLLTSAQLPVGTTPRPPLSAVGTTPNPIPQTTPLAENPSIPLVDAEPLSGPIHYGNPWNEGSSLGSDRVEEGISVTARLLETLPDTYSFINYPQKQTFQLLRMETVSLLSGNAMTQEFFYMVPDGYMADYSLYDCFVIIDMSQYGYEYSVVYNQTQEKTEQLPLVLFGHGNGYVMGRNFNAYDTHGNSDNRLWNTNTNWIGATANQTMIPTLAEAEEYAKNNDSADLELSVASLQKLSGEAKELLLQITSGENGLYIPKNDADMLFYLPSIQFHATRYINHFATNETVSIWEAAYSSESTQEICDVSKAHFTIEDLEKLPDLASGITSVATAFASGKITPPHIKNYENMKQTSYGIFAWYAKTPSGVIGVVRITWEFDSHLYDDAYYLVEYGADSCTPIERDALLEKLGDYEKTYIYTDKYDAYGKVFDRNEPQV